MQHEQRQFVRLRAGRARAGGNDLAELKPGRVLGYALDVVRVIVLAVDEDDLLGPAGDVEVAIDHHAEIARVQPAVGADHFGVDVRRLVVARRHVRPADQQVADGAVRERAPIGGGDADLGARNRLAHRHQRQRILTVRRHRTGRRADAERMAVEGPRPIAGLRRREALCERRFGQAVDGEHRRLAQAVRLHARHELVAEVHRDRFGTVVDQADFGQVGVGEGTLTEHLEVMAVAEVRRARDRRAVAAGEGRPQQRPPDEQIRRHVIDLHAVAEHEQVKADQAHVVGERHPAQRDILRREARYAAGARAVGEDVAVGQDDALRLARRARRELDEGDVVGAGPDDAPGAADVVEFVNEEGAGLQRIEGGALADAGGERLQPVEVLAVRVQVRGAELARDAQELVPVLVADADRERHRHDAAGNGGPVAVQELLVVVQEDDQLVAASRSHALQVIEDARGALVELGVFDDPLLVLALEIMHGAWHAPVALESLGQGLVLHAELG